MIDDGHFCPVAFDGPPLFPEDGIYFLFFVMVIAGCSHVLLGAI